MALENSLQNAGSSVLSGKMGLFVDKLGDIRNLSGGLAFCQMKCRNICVSPRNGIWPKEMQEYMCPSEETGLCPGKICGIGNGSDQFLLTL